jgi:hypothetical protein
MAGVAAAELERHLRRHQPEQVSENVKAKTWKVSAEKRDAVDRLTQR